MEQSGMIDREKVIGNLEVIKYFFRQCRENFSLGSDVENSLFDLQEAASGAITLLKEQEPILLENQHKPYGISTNANSPWISRCPRCGKKVEGKQTRFCKYCGQAVKWE